MKLKTFLLSLVLLLSFTLPTQANTFDDEKTNITILDPGVDICLQVAADYTNQGDYQNSKGLHILQTGSDRHLASFETSRYSAHISIDKGTVKHTNGNKIEASYSIIAQSERPNTSGVHLRRTEASGTNLQGDHSASERDKYKQNRNYYGATKPNEFLSKTLFLDRVNICRSNCSSIVITRI